MAEVSVWMSRRRRIVAIAAVVGALAALPLFNSAFADRAQLGIARAADILGLLESRSPGERLAAGLIKSKQRKALRNDPVLDDLVDRALGKVFLGGPPPAGSETFLVPPEELLVFGEPEVELEVAGFGPDLFPGGGSGSGGGYISPPGSIGGGGGGGGGGSVVPPPPGTPVPEPVAPVPEPDTWAMMVLGLGLCGFALRRRRREAVASESHPCPDQ